MHSSKDERSLGFFSATLIIIAAMIGTGVFTLTGFLVENLSSPFLMISAWILVGVISLCGALCYAEISSLYNENGGEYLFLSRLVHPSVGFLSGWASFIVGFSAPGAASAVAFGTFCSAVIGTNIRIPLALLVVLLFSVIHIRGLKTGGYLQNMLTVLKVLLVFIFLVFGSIVFFLPKNHMPHWDISLSELFRPGYATSLLFISYAYAGWNMVVYIAGEIKRPERNIPLALIAATVIVSVLYVMINVIYLHILTFDEMNGVLEIGYLAMRKLYGDAVGGYFSLGISLALVSMVSSLLMAGPRIYMKVGDDFKLFRSLSLKSSYDTPVIAIIMQCVLTMLLIVTMSYEHLLYYIGFVLSIFTVLTVSCVFYVRAKQMPAKFKMPLYPLPPVLFLVFNVIMLYNNVLQRPLESLVGALTLLAGYGLYLYAAKKEKTINTDILPE
jgi:APA family basic amino acid/polyamine antiporter